MEYIQFIWFIGSVLVLLSWYQKIPGWLGWLGFLVPMAMYALTEGMNDGLDWIYLWIVGAILVVISWLPKVHRVFGWTGLFISLIAAAMEWIASEARYHWPEPYILTTPEIDLLIYSLFSYFILNEWYLRFIKRDPSLMQKVAYINYLKTRSDYWQKHPSAEKFQKRINLFWIRSSKELWELWEMMGSMIASAMLISVLSFLLIAANYYNTQIDFDFVLFSCNWFWAEFVYFLIIGVPLYYIQEWMHDLRIMVSEK